MSNANQETIADIVAALRAVAYIQTAESPRDVLEFVNRIEAAMKREREAGLEVAKICGEIGEMIGREAACKQSVTDCNHLGNTAKQHKENTRLRAALKSVLDIEIDMNTSDLAMSMAIKNAKRIYNELQHA